MSTPKKPVKPTEDTQAALQNLIAQGRKDGMIRATELNAVLEKMELTAEKIEEVKAGLMDGSIHAFDTSLFTVGGETLTSYKADVDTDAAYEADTEVIADGYFHESEYRSAPYFDVRIDGITTLNEKF